jgi:tRNA pseudouridine55 synthase
MEETTGKFPEFNFTEGELLLIDKPLRWTSFDVVSKIRNSLKPLKLKVGHAGTLDPLATGLLIICTGKLTKKIDEYQGQEKEYTGTMFLGATTPSYDLETEIDQTFNNTNITEERIHQNCSKFIGSITQQPPAHSAIKINGERSYLKARRGEAIEMKGREVTVSEFEITRIALPEVDFRIVCSKGTYIRSLVHDFGKSLNTGAYLAGLRRTRSGEFRVEDAYDVMQLVYHIRGLRSADR